MALSARRDGRAFILPEASAGEAALVQDATVFGARTLLAVCEHLAARVALEPAAAVRPAAGDDGLDLADVRGQLHAKRALEIAAAGGHSLLFAGPPGTGKSMLAQRLPSLLPPLSEDDALEVAAIASIAGRFAPGRWGRRPFRAPHRTRRASGPVAPVGRRHPWRIRGPARSRGPAAPVSPVARAAPVAPDAPAGPSRDRRVLEAPAACGP